MAESEIILLRKLLKVSERIESELRRINSNMESAKRKKPRFRLLS